MKLPNQINQKGVSNYERLYIVPDTFFFDTFFVLVVFIFLTKGKAWVLFLYNLPNQRILSCFFLEEEWIF